MNKRAIDLAGMAEVIRKFEKFHPNVKRITPGEIDRIDADECGLKKLKKLLPALKQDLREVDKFRVAVGPTGPEAERCVDAIWRARHGLIVACRERGAAIERHLHARKPISELIDEWAEEEIPF